MSAMDHSSLLGRLIDLSERALQMRYEAERDGITDLANKLAEEHEKPAEGARVIGYEIIMCCDAVLEADRELRGHDRRRAAIFLRVVGVLLPEVRIALAVAIEQRKRPSA